MIINETQSFSSAPSSRSPTGIGFGGLTAESFAKIIFTELGKQDPLQPSDTNALLEQISTLRSIQSNMNLTTQLSELVSQNEFASAATLVGASVSGVSQDNERISGTVRSVSRTTEGSVVELATGERISVRNIDTVSREGGRP